MRLYYILNAQMPHKKAYGIQAAKMCEAFVEAGIDLTLVVPRTSAQTQSMRDFYHLRVDIPTVRIAGFDYYNGGRAAFFLSAASFMVLSFLYVLFARLRGQIDAVYTIDSDTFSFAFLPLIGVPVFAEMHTPKNSSLSKRFFFKHASLIIATNSEIAGSLRSVFDIPDTRICIEPNGVDITAFEQIPSKGEARTKLRLPGDAQIALYVGRFWDWKGLPILMDAAKRASEVSWYVVGGNAEEFRNLTRVKELPSNLHITGECASNEVPIWLAAADALLVIGTKANEESYRYTSPMKVYEYMAARRPIVAADTPALKSIVSATDAYFYATDDADNLAHTVRTALGDPSARARVALAQTNARGHSWKARAERILTVLRRARVTLEKA